MTNGKNPVDTDSSLVSAQPLEGEIRQLLFTAIKNCTDDNTGWAYVGQIGSYLNQTKPDFDSRSYGYAKLSSMLRELGGLQFKNENLSKMYCRKIPYSDLIRVLEQATKKFPNKEGWTKVSVIEKYVKPRWDFFDFGFSEFEELLDTVHHVEFSDAKDSIKIIR